MIYIFNHLLKVTADLTPLNAQKVAVKFDYFKIAGLVSSTFFTHHFTTKGYFACNAFLHLTVPNTKIKNKKIE